MSTQRVATGDVLYAPHETRRPELHSGSNFFKYDGLAESYYAATIQGLTYHRAINVQKACSITPPASS